MSKSLPFAILSFLNRIIKHLYVGVTLALVLVYTEVNAQNCSVNAGISQTVCANQQLFLQGSYTPPIKTGEQVLWKQIAGPAATIVDPTKLNTEVKNLLPGNNYTFRIYTTCADGALTYQDVTHTVKAISTAYAGPDATYCPGESAYLSANAPGAGEIGTWTGGGSGISISNVNNPTSAITISGNSSGTATLRWTITNSVTGCSSYDEVAITNRGGVAPVSAGSDQTLDHCYSATQSTSLNGSFAGSGIDGQIGTWSVVNGPNVPTIVSPHSRNSSVTNLITGTYVFRWTVVGSCVSGTDEVVINVPAPTANITPASVTSGNQTFCDANTTSTVLYGIIPAYVNETVQWTLVSKTGGADPVIVNPTSPVTAITGLTSPYSYTFKYTINNSVTSCSSSANVTISYLPDSPSLSITTASPILLSCGTYSTTINFNAGGSGTTEYRIASGPGSGYSTSWTVVGGSSFTLNGLNEVGTYIVQMRRSSTVGSALACGTVYAEISIVTSQSSDAANAGTDQNLNCNVTSTDLIGNTPSVGVGTWSQVSGPSVIILSNPHSPTLSIADLQPNGLYVFRWLISGGPNCTPSQDDVKVLTASTSPVSADAGPDQSNVCYNTPLYLNATAPTFVFERGTWSVSPSEGVVCSDTHDPKAIVNGLVANTVYTFTWTVANGCGSVSDNTTVSVINTPGPIVAIAGADQCMNVGTTSITLTGNSPSPGTGVWTQLSGPAATITNNALYNTSVSGLTTGTYKFEWAIYSGGCVPTRDTVTVTVANPIQTFNAGTDQQICGNTATLTTSLGANPSVGTGKWSQVSGNATNIDSPDNYTTAIRGLVSGTYVYRYTITNGGCSSYDDVTLYVSEPASPANIQQDNIGVCGASTASLVADPITSGSGFWTLVSGPNTPNIVTSSSSTTTVTGLITGTYIFKWTVSGGPFCPITSDQIAVTVTLNAVAGSDQSYCDGITAVNLSGTVASLGTWSQVSGPATATITTTGNNAATASGLVPGVYTFRYTISATGCSSQDDMTVTLYSPPSIADAGVDQEQCSQTVFNLAATVPASGTGVWSKLSGPSGGTFGNVNSPTTTFSGAVSGIYVFQWKVSNGSCSNADQVRITNYAAPTVALAGSDQNLTCATSVIMAGNNPDNGLGTWTFVSTEGDGPTPTITNPILYNTTITGLGPKSDGSAETYTFRWTISNGSVCSPTQDDVAVKVYQLPTAANAGADQVLCNQSSVILGATPVGTGTGTWTVTPSGGISFSDINSPTATATGLVGGTTYTFRWTSKTEFCESYDEMTVTNSAQPTAANVASTVTSYCSLVPIVLQGNTPTVGTGQWTQTGGNTLVILSPTSPTTSAIGGTLGDSYTFVWTISNGNCESSSATVTVTMNNMPSIALAGADQTICSTGATTSAIISGNATGGGVETGLWSIVTNAEGTPTFADATTPTTTISGLVGGSPNVYELQWTHAQGSCTVSDNMLINVWAAPTTADAGINQTLCNSSSFTLTGNTPSVGSGTWTKVSGPNNPTITSPNSPTTTITGVTSGTYVFRWTISNGMCTSSADDVTIVNRPVISLTGPSNAAICIGGNQNLTVTASGGSGVFKYEWQYYDGGWTNVGSDINSYSTGVLGTAGSYAYRVTVADQVIANNGGCTATSTTATVTVVADPAITTQPTNPADICQGGSTGNITLVANGGTPSLTYQWQYYNGTSWNNVANGAPTDATYSNPTSSTTFQIGNISAVGSYQYQCLVSATGNDCNQVTSSSITLKVIADPILTNPAFTNSSICAGGTTTVSSTISGGTGTPTYQWQYSANGTSGWGNIVNNTPSGTTYTNSNTPTMTIVNASGAGTRYYRLTTDNGLGCNFTSASGSYTVVADPSITTQPSIPSAICVGGTSANMSVVATGGTPSLNYQWQYNNSGTWGAVSNGTPTGAVYSNSTVASNFSVSGISVAGAYQYRCQVTAAGDGCGVVNSTTRTLNVIADPSISAVSTDATICQGGTYGLSVTASGGTPSLNYQWQSSTTGTGGPWTNVGTNTSTYTTAALNQDTYYQVQISATGNDCNTVTSTAVTVTVNNFTSANTINTNQTICSGTSASLTGNDVSADGAVTYQWQYKTSLAGSYANVSSGGTNRDYTTPALTTNTWYQRIATSTLNGVDCIITSNEVKVTVPSLTTQPVGSSVSCEGASYSMTVAVDFGSSSPTYQWQYTDFDCVSGWADIVGANSSTYVANSASLPQLGGTRNFRCIISVSGSPSCSPALVSDCAPVTVSGCNPKIGLAKELVSMDNNGDGTYEALFNLRVQNYGGVQLDNIQVIDNLNTTFGAGNYAVLGISSANFAVNTAFNGNGDQNLLVSTGNSLAKNASSDIRLRVKILSAGSYNNTATASSSTGSVSDTSTDGSDPDPDHDGDLAEHSVPTPVITACSPVMTASVSNGQMCYPTATTYTLNAIATNYSSLSWTTDGTGSFNNATILNPIYSPSASDVQDGQVILKLTAKSGGVCPNVEAQMILTIWTPPTVDAGPNTTICSGSTHILTGAVAYNYTSLTWTTSGSGTFNNPNAPNPTYTPSVADRAAGSVTLTVTATAKGTCSNVSDNMILSFTTAPTVNAGIDASICSTSSTYTLSGTATNYSSVLWTTNGTGTFSNATILNPAYTPSAADVATGQVQIALTATGNGSCGTVSDFMVLNIWPAPTVDAGPTTASICQGNSLILSGATAANHATLTWTVSGGTGTFDNANALNPTFTPTSSGTLTLTLTATSLNGICSNASNSLTLTVNAAPTLSAAVNSNTTCNNSAGSVTLSSGGVNGTFILNGVSQSGTTATFNNLTAGNDMATFTSLATGCSATTNFQITNSNSNLSGTVTVNDVVCNGGTGSVLVNATGGTISGGTVTATDGYRYSLDGGAAQASNSFSSLAVGYHTVKITDDNACTYTIDFDIDQPTQLVAEITGSSNVSCRGGANGKATVNATGGTTPYTYLWSNGQTTSTASNLSAGYYSVTVTDAKGCTQVAAVTITEPSILTVSAFPSDVTCNGGSNGSIAAIVSGGTKPYIIQWSNGSSALLNSGLKAGSYNITVTDVNGCVVNAGPYTVSQPAAVTLMASSPVNTTCGAATGSVVLTSSDGSPVTLNGTTLASGSTFTGLLAGYYTATSNGTCPASTTFRISNTTSTLSAAISSLTAPLCHNGIGSVVVSGSGGTGTLSYSLDGGISQSSGSFTNISVGNHTVKVNDANGCIYTVNFYISNPAALVLSLAGTTDVNCYGASTGSSVLIASGGTTGYTYSVDAGGPNTPTVSGNVVSGMQSGIYTARVTDANACTVTLPVTIRQPASPLDITTTPAVLTQPSCYGTASGGINITLTGGTGPYTYTWSNGLGGEDLSNVAAGSYSVNATDANGCTITGGPYILTNPAAVTLMASSIVNTNCNALVGSAVLTSSDGSSVTLNGVTKSSGSTFTGLAAGYYTATTNGTCHASANFNISNTNSSLAATVSFTDILCNGGTTTATILATGGTGTKTFVLDGSVSNTSGIFGSLAAGPHVVLITDGNGCNYSVSFDIDQPTRLTLALASKQDVSCQGHSDGSVIIQASGGTTAYTYSIVNKPAGSSASVQANSITGMKAGNYILSVTDANNCTADLSVTISETACNPVATNDNRTAPENNTVTGNVLDNDSDPNGLTLSVTQYEIGGVVYLLGTTTTITNIGTVVVNANGTYSFKPVSDYNGTVPNITYTITNGTTTATATLSISVLPENAAPTAYSDSNTTPEDTPVSGSVAGNDSPSSDGGNVWSLSGSNGGATHGTITMDALGNYTYSPAANYVGTDTVTYSLCDTNGDCATSTLVITVTPVNDAPVANNDIKTTPENVPATGNVLDNDTDIDGGTLSVTTFAVAGTTYPAGTTVTITNVGSIVVNANGEYTFVPTPNYNGPVPIVEYSITDGVGGTGTATLSFTILPYNSVPVTVSDSYPDVIEDIPYNGNLGSNDVISSDGGNIWSIEEGPLHGSADVRVDGKFTYTPAANYNGPDSFTYKLCDTNGDCSTATVSFVINPVNDAPVCADDYVTTNEDTPITFNILSNDNDTADGSSLNPATIDLDPATPGQQSVYTVPGEGTYTVSTTTGIVTFTPALDFNGETTPITYQVCDNGTPLPALCSQAKITVKVLPENDPPVAGIASLSTQQNPGGTLTVPVLANKFSGTDTDGIIEAIKITTMPTNVTSLIVDGIIYTSIPSGGIIVNTNPTGQPLFNIAVDPIDDVSEVVVSYYVIDNKGLSSVLPGSVIVPFKGISITGTVYSDSNGLTDNTVNGTGTNAGGALYINLVNTLNQVVSSKPVAANGTYSFAEDEGLTLNSSYNLILSNGAVTAGSTLSHATYPSGIVSVGENIGAGPGSDYSVDGVLAVNTDYGNVTNANFGVDVAAAIICPAGSTFVVSNTSGKCGYVVSGTQFDATVTNKNGSVILTHNYGAWGNPYSLSGATFSIGTTVVTWTAKDTFGNESSCSISVTVKDNEAPTFVNCSSGVTFTISLSPDVCETGAIWSRPVAIDNNCSTVSLTQTSGPAQGSKLEIGTYEIEYTATDESGNSSTCSFNVKVIDTERPRVVCRPDFEVPADKGNCSWTSVQNSLSPLLTSSNCSAKVYWEITDPDGVTKRTGYNDASGQVFKKGTSTVKYRIQEDASSQSWDCSFRVTVVDREAPEIVCAANIERTVNVDGCSALITLTEPSYNDCSARKSVSYSVVNPDNSQTVQLYAASYTFKAGISRVIWAVTDDAGNSSTCIQQITVTPDASIIKPYAGPDAEICEGSTYTLTTSSVAYYKTLLWTTSGTGKFSDPTALHPTYIPSNADIINGEAELKLTANSGCTSASAIMSLHISRNASVKAGPTKAVYSCAGADCAIIGATQSNAAGIQWSTSGTGHFSNALSLSPVYYPSTADVAQGSVKLTITAQSAGSCGSGSDYIVLHLVSQSKVEAGADIAICEGDQAVLGSSSATGAKSLQWKTNGSGAFSDPATLHPTYIPSAADLLNGQVILTLVATSEYPCAESQDELVLTISKLPKVNAGADISACSGELVKVSTTTAANCSGILWTTNGKGTLSNEKTLSPVYKPAAGESGKLRFILTGNGLGACTSAVVSDTLYVNYFENLSVEVMKTDTILYNTKETLWVTASNGSGNYVYNWSPNNLIPSYNLNRVETLPLKESTLFSVTISDLTTGCSITEQVMVVVEKQVDSLLEFYNGLTPNGDGHNDTWWIDGIEKFPDNEVLIFNRWGDKIIEYKHYDNVNVVWNGNNSRGDRVPDGTYYYLVKITGVKSYTGWIELRSGSK
jgi:gliding motility-associated-like protein